MTPIVLTDDQVRLLSGSAGNVEFWDSHGKHLGYFAQGSTAEDIKLAKQSLESDEPRYTTQQVLQHLQSLEQR